VIWVISSAHEKTARRRFFAFLLAAHRFKRRTLFGWSGIRAGGLLKQAGEVCD
jgi:hypothetical protein